jgi:hypothetical protein
VKLTSEGSEEGIFSSFLSFLLSFPLSLSVFSGFHMFFPRAHSIFPGQAKAEGSGGHNEPLADGGWESDMYIAMI